jgi:hypothetical protein
MAEFPRQQSRFQSFFGVQERGEAVDFAINRAKEHNDPMSIWKVTSEDHKIVDMSLLETPSLAGTLRRARTYWNGNGSDNPEWEVLLAPPIKAIEHVETVP